MQADFNKRELKKFLKKAKVIGEGYYGICYEHNNDYLIKAYIDEFHRDNYKEIIKNITKEKIQEIYTSVYGENHITNEKRIRELMKRLSYTKYNYDLIQGHAYYDNYCFGCILTYYKDYFDFNDTYLNSLTKDALEELFNNLNVSLQDLMKHHIYPTDIKEDNVLFDKNLNVKFIDLDDNCTIYANEQVKKLEGECKGRILTMKERIK